MAYQFNPTMGGMPFGIMGGMNQSLGQQGQQGIMPPSYQAPERGDGGVSPWALALLQAGAGMAGGDDWGEGIQGAAQGIMSGYMGGKQMADRKHRNKVEDARWEYEQNRNDYRDSRDYGFQEEKFDHTKSVNNRQLDQGDARIDQADRHHGDDMGFKYAGLDQDASQHDDMMGYRNDSLSEDKRQFGLRHGESVRSNRASENLTRRGQDNTMTRHNDNYVLDQNADARAEQMQPYTIEDIIAGNELTRANTARTQQQTEQSANLFPVQMQGAQADVASTRANTVNTQAQTQTENAMRPGSVAAQDALTTQRNAAAQPQPVDRPVSSDEMDLMLGELNAALGIELDEDGNRTDGANSIAPQAEGAVLDRATEIYQSQPRGQADPAGAMRQAVQEFEQSGQFEQKRTDSRWWGFSDEKNEYQLGGAAQPQQQRNPSAQSGGNAQGAGQSRDVPPRPSNVPAGSAYSPSRGMWRTPDGQLYDRSGKPAG